MKYKAIIFDLDGTIADTNHIWQKVNHEILESRGITITPELDKELKCKLGGLALDKSSRLLKEIANLSDNPDDLAKEKQERTNAIYQKGISFIKGFLEFHQEISQYHLNLGIASNANDTTLTITNHHLKLDQLFGKHIYNISHVNNLCKPDPALYLYAAKNMQIDPQHCIAIEDSAHGVTAAINAGIFCVGINTENMKEQIQEADLVVDGYTQIQVKKLLQATKKKRP